MERKTYGKVLICCICFLTLIYGLARMDRRNRINERKDQPTMAQHRALDQQKDQAIVQRVMYLTFDDGPSKHTKAILDILDQYQIKATFFVSGADEASFDLLTEIHKRGHALGIHTYSHAYSTIYSSVDAYFQDVDKVKNLIYEKTGVTTHILRFPGGSSNTVSRNYRQGIMSELAKECEKRGYVYYDWNGENGDIDSSLSADTLYEKAMKSCKGKQSVMMLMHDGAGNEATLQALERTLEEWIAQGWEFRIIEESDDMPIFHHTIAN